MSKLRDAKKDIINAIVLETGFAKKNVEKIVDSFLGVYQDKISDGRVYIKGFGEMIAVMEKRRHYNIHKASVSEPKLRPTIRFRPTNSFLSLVRYSQGDEEDKQGE